MSNHLTGSSALDRDKGNVADLSYWSWVLFLLDWGGSAYGISSPKTSKNKTKKLRKSTALESRRPCSHPWTTTPRQSRRPTTKCIINEVMLPRKIVEADPEGCDSETKSVEGVDGKDSVWSSIGPPASLPKMINVKGKDCKTFLLHLVVLHV